MRRAAVSAHTEQIYLQYGVCVSYEEECSSSEMLKQGLSGAHLTIRTIRFYANLLLRFCAQDSRLHTASVQIGTEYFRNCKDCEFTLNVGNCTWDFLRYRKLHHTVCLTL